MKKGCSEGAIELECQVKQEAIGGEKDVEASVLNPSSYASVSFTHGSVGANHLHSKPMWVFCVSGFDSLPLVTNKEQQFEATTRPHVLVEVARLYGRG